MSLRIHITGASGSGTSTLARALASRLESQAFDTDDFYWRPTEPAFQEKRPIAERLDLMGQMFLPRSDWVLSGSLHTWGGPIMARVTHVVFLTVAPGVRLARLRVRERRRYGARIAAGGDLEAHYRGFLDWAMSYDDPGTAGRSRAEHEAWLDTLKQPIIRLDADAPPSALAQAVTDALDEAAPAA
ncbi:MAG: AAA family ATPase [Pseudomonadota bacterium]